MNIWVMFHPGSAGSAIEMILRSCTNLNLSSTNKFVQPNNIEWWGHSSNLSIFKQESPYAFTRPRENLALAEKGSFIVAHGVLKEYHIRQKEKLKNLNLAEHKDNIITPIVPLTDMQSEELFEYIKSHKGSFFYLGPNNNEFAIATLQKVPRYIRPYASEKHIQFYNKNVKDISELQLWQQRDYLSYRFLKSWKVETTKAWNLAIQYNVPCYETQFIFKNFKSVCLDIIQKIGCSIKNHELFEEYVNVWSTGQDKIWNDWENYVKYKDCVLNNADYNVTLSNILLESCILTHARAAGKNLSKITKLNTFPTSIEMRNLINE